MKAWCVIFTALLVLRSSQFFWLRSMTKRPGSQTRTSRAVSNIGVLALSFGLNSDSVTDGDWPRGMFTTSSTTADLLCFVFCCSNCHLCACSHWKSSAHPSKKLLTDASIGKLTTWYWPYVSSQRQQNVLTPSAYLYSRLVRYSIILVGQFQQRVLP